MTAAQTARTIVAALALSIGLPVAAGWAQGAGTISAVTLNGAGATFPAPLYKKWMAVYQASHPNVSITYEAVGSGEGVKRFLAETVDFAGSDESLSESDASKVEGGAATVPATAGMVVLAYNIPGVTGEIRLPRDVYADIFAGAIRRWNDPRIHTRHLAAADPSWQSRGLGVGKLVAWPSTTMLATGNEGMAARIKISEGAIGYVEYGFAKRLGLPMAALQNKSGAFVVPTEASAQLALSARVVRVNELERSIVDPSVPGAYPIVSYSWLFLYRHYRQPEKAAAIRDFVAWGLSEGQQYGAEFGYVPLSPDVVALGRQVLDTVAK